MYDEFGNRMKEYEAKSNYTLERKTPVIIRLDMKAGHSFTKGFTKPFDSVFHSAMNQTMLRLCENIQGVEMGYTQSDEITLLLQDYKNENTDAWFGYRVQKLASVAASMATLYFNEAFNREYLDSIASFCGDIDTHDLAHDRARRAGALFDARTFNVPFDEVFNVFKWRQVDCRRNAILSFAQCTIGHRACMNKSCTQLEEELSIELKKSDLPNSYFNGTAAIYNEETGWTLDYDMPVLKYQNGYDVLTKYCI